jgi:hypothetical protein
MANRGPLCGPFRVEQGRKSLIPGDKDQVIGCNLGYLMESRKIPARPDMTTMISDRTGPPRDSYQGFTTKPPPAYSVHTMKMPN